jgi:hypothetical protein
MTYRIEEPVKILFHLNEGYTKVLLERFSEHFGDLDIPTEKIPHHLRKIGSRFVLILEDSHSETRISDSEIRIVEIPKL